MPQQKIAGIDGIVTEKTLIAKVSLPSPMAYYNCVAKAPLYSLVPDKTHEYKHYMALKSMGCFEMHSNFKFARAIRYILVAFIFRKMVIYRLISFENCILFLMSCVSFGTRE